MKKRLELLQELQAIDTQIDSKSTNITQLKGEIAGWEATMSSLTQVKDALVTALDELQAERVSLEEALQTEQDNVKRSENHMKEIKTNKEFQAIGREIATARKQITDIEDRMLAIAQRIEDTLLELTQSEQAIQERQQENDDAIEQYTDSITTFTDEISQLTNSRATITAELAPSIVKRYTMLRDQRRGIALAIAQDGSCLGCNMHLPPQLYNSLFKGEEMLSCPHCQRILILKVQEEVPA